jgi:DNA-damage-inducible protein J
MAPGEATVRAKIPQFLKDDTDAVFQELGMSSSEAIRLFLNQVRLHRGLPFAVSLPPRNEDSDLLLSGQQRQAALDLCYDD